MAALTEQPPVAPSSFDHDIDSFLNLDQLTYTSEPSRSKTTLSSTQPAVQNPAFVASSQSPVIFQGPSHQYDEHKQQTGLPPGALAQAMTYNHVNGMGFGGTSPGFPMNAEMMQNAPMKREDDSLDFNSMPTRNPSDMDLESDSMGAVPTYYQFSPNPNNNNNTNKSQYVDPNALGGHEVVPMGPSTQVGRMYPGMHSQQAAMARAAQQQKHHEMLRQQHIQQQQQQQQQCRMDDHMQQAGPPQPRAPNPVVDERISRLLQQMRQTAVTSPDETPSPSSLPQMAKSKKDEQEMDEDERLLASEEGKKLSSKERRQLRNKVSARAFRSRRKEYIGQLESEVAAKTSEAHDLRLQNRTLYEENARLTDLVRMLLSSPHFSSFLEETNANGIPFNNPTQQTQQQAQQSQPQPQQHPAMSQPQMQSSMPKEAPSAHPPQDFNAPQNSQVGMVMVPQQGLEVSTMGLNGGWNSGIDMNYGNASVFAVLEVPEPPAIDTEFLSGKGSGLGSYLPETTRTKDEAPILDTPPVAEHCSSSDIGVEDPEYEIDESDPAFALFMNSPTTPSTDASPSSTFDGLRSDKPAPVYELVVENESRAAVGQLAQFCHDMEAAFQRVSLVTSHLS
ncbi:hypothetical protein BDV59DRAFT_176930 [Aspergillus ambiguus]|uniref:bZIP transcription factor n=1 Tax=Aspergillus ambiguus TaxID=176160 RepID=UPI003CCD689F